MTMADEMQDGHQNRETWAFNLHWQANQGTYKQVIAWGRQWAGRSDWELGSLIIDAVKSMWEEDSEHMALREVGSFWRVDEADVARAVRGALANESE